MPAGGRHARVEPHPGAPPAWFFSLRAAAGLLLCCAIAARAIAQTLPPPMNIVVTPGEGSLTVSWDAVAGARLYSVQRKSGS